MNNQHIMQLYCWLCSATFVVRCTTKPPDSKALLSYGCPLPFHDQIYAERYHHHKAPRKLLWRPTLGVVELEVTVGDQSMDFKVTPIHAAIVLHFKADSVISLQALAKALDIPQVSNGVVMYPSSSTNGVLNARSTCKMYLLP